MSLTPGSRIGPYEVNVQIGRQVAIKILPATVAHDPERLARFEREAKTLAALNHPNVAQVYGLEKAEGLRALVMELVEGLTSRSESPRDRSRSTRR